MQNDASLREAYRLSRAVTEGLDDPIFVKDAEGRYLMINSAGARFFGKTVEDVLGKDDATLLPPVLSEKIRQEDLTVMASGVVQISEETMVVGDTALTYLITKGHTTVMMAALKASSALHAISRFAAMPKIDSGPCCRRKTV